MKLRVIKGMRLYSVQPKNCVAQAHCGGFSNRNTLSIKRGFTLRRGYCSPILICRANASPANDTNQQEQDQPDWYKALEQTAEVDEDIAALLEEAKRNPNQVRQRMKQEMDDLYGKIAADNGNDPFSFSSSSSRGPAPMSINIRRPVDPQNLWIWVEFWALPSPDEVDILQEVLNSWYVVGKLGGFNGSNTQVMDEGLFRLTGGNYDQDIGTNLPSTMHEMTQLETNELWGRFCVDLGSADELAIDVLINMLMVFSKEHVGLRSLCIGGVNDDWGVGGVGGRGRVGSLTDDDGLEYVGEKVTMNPMRGPVRLNDDDDEWDDDVDVDFEGDDEIHVIG